MKLVSKAISLDEIALMAKKSFGNLVKAVVDVEKGIMVLDGELHADEEALLLERGSKQENLWGINLYPGKKGADFIEFDSLINVRPSIGNLSRNVENEKIRKKISKIISELIKK